MSQPTTINADGFHDLSMYKMLSLINKIMKY